MKNELGLLEETDHNIELLIQCAVRVRSMAVAFEKVEMPQSALMLREVFEDIMRVAASLQSQQSD
jgi:hypothetical protein